MASLYDLVNKWASYHDQDTKDWMKELSELKIRNLDLLRGIAMYPDRWDILCKSVSLVLSVKLETWKQGVSWENVIEFCPFVDEDDKSLLHYKQVAKCIEDAPEIKKIEAIIKEIEESKEVNAMHFPFIYLGGSSGSGKTQAALTLREKFRSADRQFFYFLGTASDRSQAVYDVFANISSGFLAAVSKDLDEIQNIECISLKSQALFTFGFIQALIENDRRPVTNKRTFISFARVYPTKILEYLESSETPVVVIDEFAIRLESFSQDDPQVRKRSRETRFMRNVFRSLNFILITTGTNSRASNLIQALNISGATDSYPWCYVVTELPRFSLNMFPAIKDKLSTTFSYILLHSRPLFSNIAASIISDHIQRNGGMDSVDERSVLDTISAKVGKNAVERKALFRNPWGALGQYMLFKNWCYSEDSSFLPSDLINGHYSVITRPKTSTSGNFILDSDGCVNGQVWDIQTHFPSPDNDLLFHLSILGCKDFSPFQSNSQFRISFTKFFSEWKKSMQFKSRLLHLSQNAAQSTNDGLFLEDCATTVICSSSRMNGLSGIKLSDFLSCLVWNIFDSDFSALSKDEFNRFLGHFSERVVPFFCAPNQDCPESLRNIVGLNVGILNRAANANRIDIVGNVKYSSDESNDVILSGECKDWDSSLPLFVLEESIIPNIPLNSNLHLVFAKSFQSKYYYSKKQNKKTYIKKFGNDQRAKNFVFFKISKAKETEKVCFQQIADLPSKLSNPSCVVLFIECPHISSSVLFK